MKVAITLAGGSQGSALARALIGRGHQVRALVRNSGSPAARDLAACGAELALAPFDDAQALRAALTDVDGLFSVQMAPAPAAPHSERSQARALAAAARAAGVSRVVHSSVSHADSIDQMPEWETDLWDRNYWTSKRDAEDMFRVAGFEALTILRPAFMMENFIAPKSAWMFPDLPAGELRTAIDPDVPLVLVAADDIAAMAAAALENPVSFAGKAIELAGDLKTLPEVAGIIARVSGRPVRAVAVSPEHLVESGLSSGWIRTQLWMNRVNYPARPDNMALAGISPTRFADWAARHAPHFMA